MIAATALVALAIVVGLFERLGIVSVARQAAAAAHGSALALREARDDRSREALSQRAARQLASAAASILVRSAAAIGAAAVTIWAADRSGLASTRDVVAFLGRWPGVAMTLVLTGFACLVGARR